jgi:hypothetical protein
LPSLHEKTAGDLNSCRSLALEHNYCAGVVSAANPVLIKKNHSVDNEISRIAQGLSKLIRAVIDRFLKHRALNRYRVSGPQVVGV